MEWLNENSGILVLVSAVISIALLVLCVWLIYSLKSKIAVQRLNFLGFYSSDLETHENYAEITVGNKSLNDVGVAELGIKNGKVNYDLTELYKEKKGMAADARIVIEQRSAISFTLSAEELKKVLIDGADGKKILKGLKIYAVDLTGNLYQGRASAVKKLLAELTRKQAE